MWQVVNVKVLANYFVKHLNTHNYWAFRMVICELLFFLNVVGNIFLMDLFLGGEFSTYGLEVATFVGEVDPQNRVDPMSRVFPRMTKCIFQKFGFSGTIEVGKGHICATYDQSHRPTMPCACCQSMWSMRRSMSSSGSGSSSSPSSPASSSSSGSPSSSTHPSYATWSSGNWGTGLWRIWVSENCLLREGAADVLDDVTHKFQMVSFLKDNSNRRRHVVSLILSLSLTNPKLHMGNFSDFPISYLSTRFIWSTYLSLLKSLYKFSLFVAIGQETGTELSLS